MLQLLINSATTGFIYLSVCLQMASGSQPLEYRKVQGFLSKVRTENQAFEPSYHNIYILSDSKGKYLQREQPAVSELIDTSRVFFWHRGGG